MNLLDEDADDEEEEEEDHAEEQPEEKFSLPGSNMPWGFKSLLPRNIFMSSPGALIADISDTTD